MTPEQEFKDFLKNEAPAIVKKAVSEMPDGFDSSMLVFEAMKSTSTFPQAIAVAYAVGFLGFLYAPIETLRLFHPKFPAGGRVMMPRGHGDYVPPGNIDLNAGQITPALH